MGKTYEIWTKDETKKLFDQALTLLKENEKIKWIGDLATEQNTYRDIYSLLVKKFPEFRTIKKEIDSILESRLVSNALDNKTNSTITIFCLKNNYGWTDKTEIKHEGIGKRLEVEIVENTDKQNIQGTKG